MKAIIFMILYTYSFILSGNCIEDYGLKKVPNSYSKSFKIFKNNSQTLLTIGKNKFFFSKSSTNCGKAIKIKIPVSKYSVASTTMLPWLKTLKIEQTLVGINFKNYVFDESFANSLIELGNPTKEEILLKNESLLYFSNDQDLRFKSTQLINVPILDYLERDPLARLEWIKVLSLFFDKFETAEETFKSSKAKYLALKRKVVQKRPKVLAGQMIDNVFHAPGDLSYFAALIADAGGEYVFSGRKSSKTIRIKKEELLKFSGYDIYLPQNNLSLGELERAMSPLKLRNVYSNTKKVNSRGGNDYWETAVVSPSELLKDLRKIFHGKSLPDHKLQWYQRFK